MPQSIPAAVASVQTLVILARKLNGKVDDTIALIHKVENHLFEVIERGKCPGKSDPQKEALWMTDARVVVNEVLAKEVRNGMKLQATENIRDETKDRISRLAQKLWAVKTDKRIKAAYKRKASGVAKANIRPASKVEKARKTEIGWKNKTAAKRKSSPKTTARGKVAAKASEDDSSDDEDQPPRERMTLRTSTTQAKKYTQ